MWGILIALVFTGLAVIWIGSRLVWRHRTYSKILARELSRRGHELIDVAIPPKKPFHNLLRVISRQAI